MGKSKKWITLLIPILVLFLTSVVLPKADWQNGRSLRKSMVNDAKQLDVNQIVGWVVNDGLMFSDPVTGQSGLYYPKGGPPEQAIIYTSGLWVLGKINNDIRSAVANYGTEFQPGMILANGSPDDPSDPKYQVYKFYAETWDDPSMAADRAAAVSQGMEDKMFGDQMLYFVMNDYASHAAMFTKPPIGLEVRVLAFGFNRVGALGNTVFVKYTFINKGSADLLETYAAQMFDPDLGQSNDDAVGCDTTLGIGYVYNMDNYDDNYGAAVPAFACDFFQGPLVPSAADTAYIPGQAPKPGFKMLQMTSFFTYINGGPAGMRDPATKSAQGAQEAYWFCQGLKSDGTQWLDPKKGNQPSQWLWYGDPVQNTGWLQKDTWPGADMRMALASGPFTLKRNTPYEIVCGYVVGAGANNLKSVDIMKANDKAAQTAYNLNFVISKPAPYPNVAVGQLDGQVVMTWDGGAVNYTSIDKVDVDDAGAPSYYNFEGYKMYQGASESGPWTLIQQWDKKNDITKIWDYVFDPVSGEFIYEVVENGKDTALSFKFIVDRDYLTNTPLVNGKRYYFSLSTYSYNPIGNPKVLENAVKVISVVPQKPMLADKIVGAPGQALVVTHAAGSSDGIVKATVVNPAALNGADYQVQFFEDSEGVLNWKVVNTTAGVTVINNLTHITEAALLDGDEEFPIVNGVQIKVSGPPPGLKPDDWSYVPSANRWLTFNMGTATNLWPLEGFGTAIGWAAHFLNGSNVPASALKNLELRFAACDVNGVPTDLNDPNVSMAYRYIRGVGTTSTPAKPEFAPFIINKGTGYVYQDMRPICLAAYDTESNPPRRLAVGFMENNGALGLINGAYMPGSYTVGGGNVDTREFLWIFASEYSATAKPEYMKDILNNAPSMDIMYASVASRRGDTAVPKAGDKLILPANHPIIAADKYSFSLKGLGVVSSAEVAKARLEDINVYPNPYFATNEMETDFFTQFVTFTNLSEKCTIRIFSLSGQMLKTIVHDGNTPFDRWDLKNEQGLPVASGMYIALVEVPNVGTKTVKLAIINREARYRHY